MGATFGESVAVDGDVIAVSAIRDSEFGFFSGAAYVFRRVAGSWVEEAKLTASNAAAGQEFGRSIAADGLWVAVGNLDNIHMFRFDGASWVKTQITRRYVHRHTAATNIGAGCISRS